MRLSPEEVDRRRRDPTVAAVVATIHERDADPWPAVEAAIRFAQLLRDLGVPCVTDARPCKLGKKFEQAEALGALFVVLIGPKEAARGTVMLNVQEPLELAGGGTASGKKEALVGEAAVTIGCAVLPWSRE